MGLIFLFFSVWNREDMAFHKHTVLRLLGKKIIGVVLYLRKIHKTLLKGS